MENHFKIAGEEVIDGEVKTFGNSAHVIVPKRWRGSEVKIVRITEPEPQDTTENSDSNRQDLPDVPHIPLTDIEYEARRNYYQTLKRNSDSLPAKLRRIIYTEGEITREELGDRVRDEHSPKGGGFSESIVVLDKVTNEIDRWGKGNNETLKWKGER